MSNLLTDIYQNIGEDNLEILVKKFVLTDKKKKDLVLKKAGSAVLGGLAKNVKEKNGESVLMEVLKKHSDNIEKVKSILNGELDKKGDGILKHTWGDKKKDIQKSVLKDSGLDKDRGKEFLSLLAPLILGGLSKTTKKTNMDGKVLGDILDMATKSDLKNEKGFSFLKILDLDRDGEIMDDLPKIWSGVLSILAFLGLRKKK